MIDNSNNVPVYTIGIAAKLLNLHPRTLRIYEAEGLISPSRISGKRYYSPKDIKWVSCLRSLIHDDNLGIEGVKRLLEYGPCWKIKNCPQEDRNNCISKELTDKKCWEFSKKVCENSCHCCEIFINSTS